MPPAPLGWYSDRDQDKPFTTSLMNLFIMLGVLVTGGWSEGADGDRLDTTEMFLPSTGKTCTLQRMPKARHGHTLDQLDDGKLLACGGLATSKTCHQFTPSLPHGTWSLYTSSLVHSRAMHTSLLTEGKLLLLGGDESKNTTEVVGEGESYNLQTMSK